MVLLEEKEQLEIRCDELETLFETTKHELDVTREALARYHESQQESTRTGIEHEESLLKESAMRERCVKYPCSKQWAGSSTSPLIADLPHTLA